MTRAVWARERHQDAEYAARYRDARAAFEAIKLDPAGGGVNAIRGGELLAGLAVAAQRTGWAEESRHFAVRGGIGGMHDVP
jgi:hypothetical protein